MKLRGLCWGAAGSIAAALIWCPWFAINKRMWTSSYVLLAGGLALALFALFYALVDLRGMNKRWVTPALVFGTNALAAYIVSELLAASLNAMHVGHSAHASSLRHVVSVPFQHVVPNPELGSFLYAVAFVAVCFVPMAFLYRRRIFIKV